MRQTGFSLRPKILNKRYLSVFSILILAILAYLTGRLTYMNSGLGKPIMLSTLIYFVFGLIFNILNFKRRYIVMFIIFISFFKIAVALFLVFFRWHDILEWAFIILAFLCGSSSRKLRIEYIFATFSFFIICIVTYLWFIPAYLFKENLVDFRETKNQALENIYNNGISYIEENRGKVLLIDFWYLRCKYCFIGFKDLEAINEYFKNNNKVKVLAVNLIDNQQCYNQGVNKILNAGYTFETQRDSSPYFADEIAIKRFPTQILVDERGNILYKSNGYSHEVQKFKQNWTIKTIQNLLLE